MSQSLTFDAAIEILEITDISSISVADLPKIIKKSRIRWHPDRIAQHGDQQEIEKYTRIFQQIEEAGELIEAYLKGEYQPGERFQRQSSIPHEAPEDIIRQEAPEMQASLRDLWPHVKTQQYKLVTEEVILSDGFRLRDLLTNDFEEDLASLSLISLVFSVVVYGTIAALFAIWLPVVGGLIGIFTLILVLACFLGFLPLSRFWLPDAVLPAIGALIDVGLGIYHYATESSRGGNLLWQLVVQIPVVASYAVKYLILFPLYEIAKLIVKDRVVGVVKDQVAYYAGVANWYVDDLLKRDINMLSTEDLFALSHLYTELKEVQVPVEGEG